MVTYSDLPYCTSDYLTRKAVYSRSLLLVLTLISGYIGLELDLSGSSSRVSLASADCIHLHKNNRNKEMSVLRQFNTALKCHQKNTSSTFAMYADVAEAGAESPSGRRTPSDRGGAMWGQTLSAPSYSHGRALKRGPAEDLTVSEDKLVLQFPSNNMCDRA